MPPGRNPRGNLPPGSGDAPDTKVANVKHKRIFTSTLTAAALAIALTPSATAEPPAPIPPAASSSTIDPAIPGGAQLVTLGDSYAANGNIVSKKLIDLGIPIDTIPIGMLRDVAIGANNCVQDTENWPRLLANQTHRTLGDFSCNARTSRTGGINDARLAADSGWIGPNTEEIIIMVGGNDVGDLARTTLLSDARLPTPEEIRNAYSANIAETARIIREAAPQATITLASYPAVVSEYDDICFINVVPDAPQGIRIPGAKAVERAIVDAQRHVAHEHGLRFVDVADSTRYHDTCAPDGERFVSGLLDTTSPQYQMSLHPTVPGSQAIADALTIKDVPH